jgi:ABC-type multidrug transport system fused ATPase/permease subunit
MIADTSAGVASPSNTSTVKQSSLHRIWQLSHIVRSHGWLFTATVAAGVLHYGAMIAGGAVGAALVAAAWSGAGLAALTPFFWMLGGLVLLRGLGQCVHMWICHDLAYRILADMRGQLYWALERTAPAYLLQRRSGDMAVAAMANVEQLEWFYAHTIADLVIAVLVTLGALIALGLIHPLLPLIMLPAIGLVCTVPVWLQRRAERQGAVLRERLGVVNAEVVDSVQGLREIVIFGRGNEQTSKLARHNRNLFDVELEFGMRTGLETAISNIIVARGVICVLITAAVLAANGALNLAWFPISVVLAASMFVPITNVVEMGSQFGVIGAAASRVFNILEQPAQVNDTVAMPPAGPIIPHVRFEDVSFAYGTQQRLALRAVSFEIQPGEMVALVGHSGAGKSTCIHLLLRFWDVTSGAITVDGHDLRAFPQAALRDLMARVPQDIYLFNTSVGENIGLGKPNATAAEMEHVARLALAHDFISALPQGYDTPVGERGAQLSGRQRQRIAIARAFLNNAPILIMDEAVSNLDTENERLLQEALQRLRAGRSTLVIAHRLSTIRSANRIVVLEDGRVAESGTYEALMSQNGVLAHLVAHQRDGIVSA